MAEIELVIKIDEDYYEIIKHGVEDGSEYKPWTLIAHGTPLKTGHWIDHQEGRWIYAQCSECGTVHDTQTNYCPNCGTKMESEDRNDKTGRK